jgi:hypothetical protein
MTTYNYFIEMQDMCFRISQACKAMNKRGTQDVYAACERGFGEMAKELNCEEAGCTITQDQLDTYLCTKNFCAEQVKQAADKINTDITGHNFSEADEPAFNEIMKDLQEDAEKSAVYNG